MTRNKALGILAWIATMVIVNATTLGDMLLNHASDLVLMFKTSKPLIPFGQTYHYLTVYHPSAASAAWWIVFAGLTLFVVILSRLFVVIWGDAPATQDRQFSPLPLATHDAGACGQAAVAKALGI